MFDNGYKVCYLAYGTVQRVAEIQIQNTEDSILPS